MNLNFKQLGEIAKDLSVSERSVERLIGSTTAEWLERIDPNTIDPMNPPQRAAQRFQLGLRLTGDTPLLWSGHVAALTTARLREYRNLCPQCFTWLCAGNFDARKPPENINRVHLLHASRTAARLRAQIMRETRNHRTL